MMPILAARRSVAGIDHRSSVTTVRRIATGTRYNNRSRLCQERGDYFFIAHVRDSLRGRDKYDIGGIRIWRALENDHRVRVLSAQPLAKLVWEGMKPEHSSGLVQVRGDE
jgi:hypothetical protein